MASQVQRYRRKGRTDWTIEAILYGDDQDLPTIKAWAGEAVEVGYGLFVVHPDGSKTPVGKGQFLTRTLSDGYWTPMGAQTLATFYDLIDSGSPDPEGDYVEVFHDQAGEYRWRRVDGGNHRIVATGGEGYRSATYAIKAAETYCPDLPLMFEGSWIDSTTGAPE